MGAGKVAASNDIDGFQGMAKKASGAARAESAFTNWLKKDPAFIEYCERNELDISTLSLYSIR